MSAKQRPPEDRVMKNESVTLTLRNGRKLREGVEKAVAKNGTSH